MSNIIQNIIMNNSVIPNIPFIWYREDQLVCPFYHAQKLNHSIFDQNNINTPNTYIVIQKNVLENPKLYVSFHSHSFYIDTKSQIIPQHFAKQYMWNCKYISLDDNLKMPNGETIQTFNQCGDAFIHGGAFSPPGVFNFTINNECNVAKFIVYGECPSLNTNVACLFIIINDIHETAQNVNVGEIMNEYCMIDSDNQNNNLTITHNNQINSSINENDCFGDIDNLNFNA